MPATTADPRVRIDHTDFAVVDVETTGLFPTAHDRIVEVAVLRHAPDGTVRDKWVSLVNPGRDMGATHVHGLSAADVACAPTFADVVGQLCRMLRGSVVIAHNARFDLAFLTSEFARAGHHLPTLPAVCTMTLPGLLGLQVTGRSLEAACHQWGVPYDPHRAHGAMHDAEAAADVFGRLLEAAWRSGVRTIDGLGCTCGLPPADAWPPDGPAVQARDRRRAHEHRQQQFGFLATVAHRAAAQAPPGSAELAPYLALLDRVLEDHVVTQAEADGLVATAREWGLSSEQVHQAHQLHLRELVDAAWADGVVTDTEQRELETVGFWLGLDADEVTTIVTDRRTATPTSVAGAATTDGDGPHPLVGHSVCFTGQLVCSHGGAPLTRAKAQALAEQAGLVVAKGVTKTLDVLVVADPDTQSGKAVKARSYGTRIMAEPVFWRTVGVDVD